MANVKICTIIKSITKERMQLCLSEITLLMSLKRQLLPHTNVFIADCSSVETVVWPWSAVEVLVLTEGFLGCGRAGGGVGIWAGGFSVSGYSLTT